MSGGRELDPPIVEWGWAGAALDGEDESGDAHLVQSYPNGMLVAAIDGLGHGFEAAVAAREAARVLGTFAGQHLETAFEACHEALRHTRGAVMTVASFDARVSSMTWLGVGNVEGVLVRADPTAVPGRETVTLRGGVVGYQLPPLRTSTVLVSPGDTLILATDGIRSGFIADLSGRGSPPEIAHSILSVHSRGTDDALVLVARYQGVAPP